MSRVALLFFAACAAAPAPESRGQPLVAFPAAAEETVVRVEIADTPDERATGLMHRHELKPDAGMIFVFPQPEDHHFWMKNTFVSLDMIFIAEDLTVAGVAPNTEPLSEATVSVGKPSKYVLEVVAGFAAEHGIAAGATARFENVPLTTSR